MKEFGLFPPEIFTTKYVIAQVVSSLALLLAAYKCFDKYGGEHPAPIIGAIMILYAIYFWFVFSVDYFCYYDFEGLFAATVYFSTDKESLLKSMQVLENSYMTFNTFFFNAPSAL